MGFQVVAELGEEIQDARRNIPLALLIGGGIVAVLYIVVGTVFVSSVPYEAYTGDNAKLAIRPTISTSAATFLSGGWVWFIGLGAWSAGLTSLNAAAIAIPREWFSQARDGVAPAWLARISPRTHTPGRAVGLYFVLVSLLLGAGALSDTLGLGLGLDVDFYGLMAAIGIQGTSAVLCLAGLALPRRHPERYRAAYIVFPRPVLWACALLTGLFSLVFLGVLALEKPVVLAAYAGWLALGVVVYRRNTRHFTAADWQRATAVPGD
jgi:APA family basic amino acid/polyamine antiporter